MTRALSTLSVAGLAVLVSAAGAQENPAPKTEAPEAETRVLEEPENPRRVYKVVVNADNPVKRLSREHVSRMFLQTMKRWDDFGGQRVQPVDLKDDVPVREVFTLEVHQKRLGRVIRFWQREIFSARGRPPLELDNDQDVLAFVAEHPGGIGYVSAGTPLIEGVREIQVVPDE